MRETLALNGLKSFHAGKNFNAVGTLEETDELFKDLISIVFSLVIHNICTFQTF